MYTPTPLLYFIYLICMHGRSAESTTGMNRFISMNSISVHGDPTQSGILVYKSILTFCLFSPFAHMKCGSVCKLCGNSGILTEWTSPKSRYRSLLRVKYISCSNITVMAKRDTFLSRPESWSGTEMSTFPMNLQLKEQEFQIPF